MTDVELLCNYKKCRKPLSTHAWVTACSHAFCDEDGTREFGKSFSCPACETNLTSECEVVRVNLQPGERYKSMILAGLKPETIMEICSSGLSFWVYQERRHQEFVINTVKERNVQLERYYEEVVSKTRTVKDSLSLQIENYKKELEGVKKKVHAVSEQLSEKCRQYQKLQLQFDKLKRKCIDPTLLSSAADHPVTRPHHPHFAMAFGGDADHELYRRSEVLGKSVDSGRPHRSHQNTPNANNSFLLQQDTPSFPNFANHVTSNAIQDRFSLGLGTPRGNAAVQRSGSRP